MSYEPEQFLSLISMAAGEKVEVIEDEHESRSMAQCFTDRLYHALAQALPLVVAGVSERRSEIPEHV